MQPLRTAATLALAWFAAAAAHVTFACSSPESIPGLRNLPVHASIGAAGAELLALAGLTALIGGPLLWLASKLEKRPWQVRWTALAAGVALLWLVVLLYALSWATYISTGGFVDGRTLVFALHVDIRQLAHWADPLILKTVPAGCLLVAMGIAASARWTRCWEAPRCRATLLIAWGGLWMTLAMLGQGWWALDGDEQLPFGAGALPYTEREWFGEHLAGQTGPALQVLADVRRAMSAEPEVVFGTPPDVIHRKQVTMKDYVSTAGKSRDYNVIVVLVESLRADQLVTFGGERDVMPALDALARQSRCFLRTYCQASHSDYADLPPIGSHYPLRSHTHHWYPKKPTYPRVLIYDVLKAFGYRTAMFSSQNEHWGAMFNYFDTGGLDHVLHAATYDGETHIASRDLGFAKWAKKTKAAGTIDDKDTVNEAIRWIDGASKQPFFIYMNLQASHFPYQPPPDFPRRFGPVDVDFTMNFGWYPRDKVEIVKNLYADSLAYVDVQLGRLIAHLRKTGQLERTIVVVTADTGQGFNEHGLVCHGNSSYEELMRVPLVVHAPGLSHATTERLAQHVDVPPTILGLLGLAPHPSFQGIDLLAPAPPGERTVYMCSHTSLIDHYALVRGQTKLIYSRKNKRYQLYDLALDPGEKRDLSRSKPALLKELSTRLQTWRKAQIDYYADVEQQQRVYPPIVVD